MRQATNVERAAAQDKRYGPSVAGSIVVANMIGTGVFTSLGFQLLDITSPFPLMALWAIGGVIALCGALCYAELGAALPRSGGEYNFLSEIYHPGVGFVGGWTSASIGFAAPTALAAITFGTYLASVLPEAPPLLSAFVLVVLVTAAHARNRQQSARFQLVFTSLKVIIIVGFCALVVLFTDAPQALHWGWQAGDEVVMASGAFAVSLIYVNYAYTGWNAATYLSGEMDDPQRNLPRVLVFGTLLVMVLYVALNAVFLYGAPMVEMAGKVEIGFVVASHAFGGTGSRVMGLVLAALLISTVSAMILAGPRVLQAIGQDFRALSWLARTNVHGLPVVAIVFQSMVTLVLIVTATFDAILVFAGFTLALNSFVTVIGVFVLRVQRPELPRPFRVPLWPLPAVVYLVLTGWTMGYLLLQRPAEGLLGIGVIVSGAVFYGLTARAARPTSDTPPP